MGDFIDTIPNEIMHSLVPIGLENEDGSYFEVFGSGFIVSIQPGFAIVISSSHVIEHMLELDTSTRENVCPIFKTPIQTIRELKRLKFRTYNILRRDGTDEHFYYRCDFRGAWWSTSTDLAVMLFSGVFSPIALPFSAQGIDVSKQIVGYGYKGGSFEKNRLHLSVGFQCGKITKCQPLWLSEKIFPYFKTDMTILPGMSGGPVVQEIDGTLCVIGASWKSWEGEDNDKSDATISILSPLFVMELTDLLKTAPDFGDSQFGSNGSENFKDLVRII